MTLKQFLDLVADCRDCTATEDWHDPRDYYDDKGNRNDAEAPPIIDALIAVATYAHDEDNPQEVARMLGFLAYKMSGVAEDLFKTAENIEQRARSLENNATPEPRNP